MSSWFAGRLGVVVLALGVCVPRLHAADTLLTRRPCGPDSVKGPLRLLIPQGAFGGDFRGACRAHDACYDTPGADRAACDARFLGAMLSACSQARHPVLCRMAARAMHRTTARHGAESFRRAQAIAMRGLATAGRSGGVPVPVGGATAE